MSISSQTPKPLTTETAPAQSSPSPAETHLESAKATTGRNNNFNVLRLLFAMMVVLSHAPLANGHAPREILLRFIGTATLGTVAVDGFFLLSGCLIVQSWQRTPDLLDFLKKRVLRIYPGFLMASVVSAFIVGPLAANAVHYFAQFNLPEFLKSAFLLQQPAIPPIFSGQTWAMVNGPMWTIIYEFRCYLLVAIWGICGLFRWKSAWLGMTIVFLGLSLAPAFVSRTHFHGEHFLRNAYLMDDPVQTIRLTTFFGVGGCFALFRERILLNPLWALLAAVLLFACMFGDKTAPFGLATFGAYLLFWFAETQSPLLARFRHLPDISYGVYLYGWPVEKLLVWYVPGLSSWLVFALACVLCVPLGLASWFGIERPFLRLKPKKSVPVPDAAQSSSP